jgi:ATP-dependent DNA helicase DinG
MNDLQNTAWPHVPTLIAGVQDAVWLSADGEIETLALDDAAARAAVSPPLVCHAKATARRLGTALRGAYDVLELYAFVRPAQFCLPTPRGLAEALGLPLPHDKASEALTLIMIARALLAELGVAGEQRSDPAAIAALMGRFGWPWMPAVLAALGRSEAIPPAMERAALEIWQKLPEWSEHAPQPPPGNIPVAAEDARERLASMVQRDRKAEPRPSQADYAGAVSAAFTPRETPDAPNLVLAEAGTGVGKTLGYLAPASLWAERNQAPVWISTYTRNLQHQIDSELARLYPDPAVRARKVVLRKGRENYLCLLNFEDAVRSIGLLPQEAVALGLLARWAAVTRDGDITGGDLPGWLPDLLGRARTLSLADRRGECIYTACTHFNRCFIEKSVRRARRADIVVANHALVMLQVALGSDENGALPTRFVLDEGHHVFDAADNAFAAHLTGLEAAELRRWLLGAEGGRSRARGLKRRVEDLVSGNDKLQAALTAALVATRALPSEGWAMRVHDAQPQGPCETFLSLVRTQVKARSESNTYALETDISPPIDGLSEAAAALANALKKLVQPLNALAKGLLDLLDKEADTLDAESRRRIESVARSLSRRVEHDLVAWIAMLLSLSLPTPAEFVDWFGIERMEGREVDVGMYRHWVDPTIPLAKILGAQAHGLVITSATLTDGTGDPVLDWQAADARSGAVHMARPALQASVPSPFDYPAQTRVLVVDDVNIRDAAQVAAAYRSLFLAAGGGALGLFTAISRLRAVYERIAAPLSDAGLPLYAQHVDALDIGTLVDIFRGEEHACLLGTDAVRDGVDVPGRSLRLIVFDRVPWPRPDLRHKARRAAFGARRYDDMLTRLRLKQAFGRLVRRADDTGVFVLLDSRLPSRLLGAFPPGVTVQRVGLAEAVRITAGFLESETKVLAPC